MYLAEQALFLILKIFCQKSKKHKIASISIKLQDRVIWVQAILQFTSSLGNLHQKILRLIAQLDDSFITILGVAT